MTLINTDKTKKIRIASRGKGKNPDYKKPFNRESTQINAKKEREKTNGPRNTRKDAKELMIASRKSLRAQRDDK